MDEARYTDAELAEMLREHEEHAKPRVRIIRLVRELQQTRREQGWQPIETAPRDGTHILVGTFPAPVGAITTAVAHWFDSRMYGAKSGSGGWALSVNYDGEHSDHGVQAPTHWRPLPSPPPQAQP